MKFAAYESWSWFAINAEKRLACEVLTLPPPPNIIRQLEQAGAARLTGAAASWKASHAPTNRPAKTTRNEKAMRYDVECKRLIKQICSQEQIPDWMGLQYRKLVVFFMPSPPRKTHPHSHLPP